MKTYLRKYILWLYVFLVTVITCAVFMIGCDGGDTGGGGGHNDAHNCNWTLVNTVNDCTVLMRDSNCGAAQWNAAFRTCAAQNCTRDCYAP